MNVRRPSYAGLPSTGKSPVPKNAAAAPTASPPRRQRARPQCTLCAGIASQFPPPPERFARCSRSRSSCAFSKFGASSSARSTSRRAACAVARLVVRERQLIQRLGAVDRVQRDDRLPFAHGLALVAELRVQRRQPDVLRRLRTARCTSPARARRRHRRCPRAARARSPARCSPRSDPRCATSSRVSSFASRSRVALRLVDLRQEPVRALRARVLGEQRLRLLERR